MYLIVGIVFIVVLLVRSAATLMGFRLTPWLPASGRGRYFADVVIAAPILLCLAIVAGFSPSFGLALIIAVLAGLIAMGLETMRKGRTARK
jgi:hypothetical protein